MRTVFCMAFLALVACEGAETLELERTGSIQTANRGVALFDDGNESFVGMQGMACTIDPDSGVVGSDVEISDDDEKILDSGGIAGSGGLTLLSNTRGVYILGPDWYTEGDTGVDDMDWEGDGEFYHTPTLAATQVKDARLTQQGLVAVSGPECTVHFATQSETLATVKIGSAKCSEDATLVATAAGDQAFVRTSEGLFSVTAQGVETLADSADVVALNQSTGRLLVVDNATMHAEIMDLNGVVQAQAILGGTVAFAQGFGPTDEFAVTMQTASGSVFGLLTAEGDMGPQTEIPEPASFDISADGSRVAFALDHAVHFFKMHR